MTVRKRGLRLGKRDFTDIAWKGELTRDQKALKFRKHRIGKNIEKHMRELALLEKNFNIEKKVFINAIHELEDAREEVLLQIEQHQIEIDKLTPKKERPKPEPEKIPEHIIVPKKPDPIIESLKETIEDITEEIIEHQERTITEVKKAVNGKFEQTIIEGKILCPECIAEGKQEEDSLFTKGGAFIAHYKSHFKNGNGDGD